MALGGGTWLSQNKVLPGAYINCVSVQKASANLSDRGYVACTLELDWGLDNDVMTVTQADFQTSCKSLFGYSYDHEKLASLRELFKYAQTAYIYRLNSGEKATCTYADAKHSGVRGNDLGVKIAKNVDDETKFDVVTILDGIEVETQTVTSASDLVDNAYLVFKKGAELAETALTKLTGGTNGVVNGDSHSAGLSKLENYSFNILTTATEDPTINGLYVAYTIRMRDTIGAKFQTVLYKTYADSEAIISVENCLEVVYWSAGAQASCAINKTLLNKAYDGELDIPCNYTQVELEKMIKGGKFVFHKVNGVVRVLEDINTLVTTTNEKGEDFKSNQTIRVIDQIANDFALIFNTKYLGVIPNDESGRISLWADFVKHHENLQSLRAIENFSDSDIVVTKGDSKKSVLVTDSVCVVNAMAKLYMTVYVS